MDRRFTASNPLRSPQWRLDRVMDLLRTREYPDRFDNHSIRIYRRFLLDACAARDDELKLEKVKKEFPHVATFHSLRYSSNVEPCQILEARLLTSETFERIAESFGTDASVVELYEQLCFSVRDRMQARDWIHKVILGPTNERGFAPTGELTNAQRGFLYRWFAFHGGPLVLNALIAGIGTTTMPQRPDDVIPWFDESLRQLVQNRALAAALTCDINRKNAFRLMKLMRQLKTAAKSTGSTAAEEQDINEHIKKVLDSIAVGVRDIS